MTETESGRHQPRHGSSYLSILILEPSPMLIDRPVQDRFDGIRQRRRLLVS